MMESRAYKNRNVAVLGLGKSGLATARKLAEGNARVLVWDDQEAGRKAAETSGLQVVSYSSDAWANVDTIILSPGIPLTHPKPHPVVEHANANRKQVIGDIEVFLKEKTSGKIVGITGTNGKSTTTALIHHILKSAGKEAALGGNIGTPVMELPQLSEQGIYVLELSSYQLDLTPSWHADVAILLNITPDHLDRHGDLEGYIAVKKRIFNEQVKGDTAILNLDDPVCQQIAKEVINDNRLVGISTKQRLDDGVSVLQGLLQVRDAGKLLLEFDLREHAALRGEHNWQNTAAAVAACLVCGMQADEVERGVLSFGGLAHRMEPVKTIGTISFVNDSKATNAEAAAKSLSSYENIYWICGGVAKAGGIEELSPYFGRVAHAFLIGECACEFSKTLEGKVPYTDCGTLPEAVKLANKMAGTCASQAVVLLAPAAASFDQFKSFEARGNQFKEIVLNGGLS